MELRVLRYFLEAAREGNITHAAERLHISQPTLSKQLKELEGELGKKLFIRGNYNVRLTDEGMLLRKRAEEERNPVVRKLLERDQNFLDRIQVQMATAREFLIIIRLHNEKGNEVFSYLDRIEKSLKEQGFSASRAGSEDIKRIMAVYYEQNVTSEKFEDFDGERWIIPDD